MVATNLRCSSLVIAGSARRLYVAHLSALRIFVIAGITAAVSLVAPAFIRPVSAQSPTSTQNEAVQGTVRDPAGDGIPDVEIIVTDEEGNEVGTTVTDSDGEWLIPLPGPGTFQVRVEPETLPPGVELRNPDRDTLEVQVRRGQPRTVLFPIGEREGGGRLLSARVAQAIVNGMKFGLIIAITAVGLSLIYGTTQMINFAHGEMVTLGAVITYMLTAGAEMSILLAGAAAIAIGTGISGASERFLWRPLRARKADLVQLLVITIGVSLFLRHLILVVFGSRPRTFGAYAVQQPLRLGPILLTPKDLIAVSAAAAVLIAVGLILTRTRTGITIRAVADNKDLAEASGADVRHVIMIVWLAGGGLAAFGGILLGLVETIDWLMGFRLLLLMFAAIILGGLGAPFGAMVGGLVVGITIEITTLFAPAELKVVWALVALIIVLLLRPQGIFGRRERYG